MAPGVEKPVGRSLLPALLLQPQGYVLPPGPQPTGAHQEQPIVEALGPRPDTSDQKFPPDEGGLGGKLLLTLNSLQGPGQTSAQ